MYAPTQEKLDSLPPLKKRLLNMIPYDKWTDPKEVAQSLAMTDGVHLSMIAVMKACHTLSKMGFMQIKETNRDQLLKRVPVRKKKESIKRGVKPK